MRVDNTSSPGISGHKCGLCRWDLTNRDCVRQEMPGAPTAGAGCRGPAGKLRAGKGSPKAAPLNSILVTKCSERSW